MGLYIEKIVTLHSVFTPSSPIEDKDIFAGRTQQLDSCIETIYKKGCQVAVYGDRGVGKTSLANVVRAILTASNAIAVVKVNCETRETVESLWKKVFDRILVNGPAAPSGIGIQAGAPQPSPKVPISSYFEDGVIRSSELDRAFALCERHLVVIFDEFDRLDTSFDRTTFTDQLKNISDNITGVTIMMLGVGEDISELIGDHASIERALKQVLMPLMSREELIKICENGLTRLGMSISKDVQEKIVDFSCGYPHFTHLLCLNAAKAALQEEELSISERHFSIAVEQSIAETQESLRSAYQNATLATKDNIFDEVIWACCEVVSEDGTFQASDLVKPLSEFLGREITLNGYMYHLGKLSSDDRGSILVKLGESKRTRYKFRTPLMRAFVRLKMYSSKKSGQHKPETTLEQRD